uniref:piwi-like protein 1 n=1 Tax=Styela clava TaxID=7725 RepID=UPI00193AA26D|nr:piwi-like protein 1 [Styela clava]
MAHHGFGRGGRGYGFLASQKEEGKPGIPEEEKKTVATDFRSLLLGRGRGAQFARGASLFSGIEKPPFMGRGAGASMGLAKSVETGQVGIPTRDPNDNILQPRVEEAQSVRPKIKDLQVPELSGPKPISLSSLTKDVKDMDISETTKPQIIGQKSIEDNKTSLIKAGISGTTTQVKSPTKVEEFHQLLGSKTGGLLGKPGLTFGRGSALMLGRGTMLQPTKPILPTAIKPQSLDTSYETIQPVSAPSQVVIDSADKRGAVLSVGNEKSMEMLKQAQAFPTSGRGVTLRPRGSELPGTSAKTAQEGHPTSLSEFHQRKPMPETMASKPLPSVSQSPEDLMVVKRDVIEYSGSQGMKVPIGINCVRLKCRNEAVYQYHVSFNPNIDNRNMRYSLLNQHRELIGNTRAFDGSILYLPIQLPKSEMIVESERITDGEKIQLKIAITRAVHPASHLLIPFYNVVLHRCMKILQMCPVGRNYYDPSNAQPVPKYKLHLWPGYVTAIREMEGGLLMNIDTSHKVLRNETVLTVMQDIYQNNRGDFHGQCIKELVGSTILTRYNNNNYRVDDIDWSMNPMSTFTTSKGETISFYDYYKAQYRIEIQDKNQPMLINRPKKATQRSKRVEAGEDRVISLVPELCFLTGLSDKLAGDFTAMKEIGNFTRLGPNERNSQIENFLQRLNGSPEARQELLKWGLELENRIVSVEGRTLPPEKVLVGNNHVFQCNEDVDFFRDISRVPVLRSVPIKHWIIVFTARDATKSKDFVRKFEEVSRKIGMQIQPPRYIELRDDRSDAFKHAISGAVNPSLQLVVCIFPTSRDDRYSAVKRLCCVEMPVPSQVILSKTLPRDPSMGKFRSVTMKIALQINCKLGGELWALSIPLEGLMICGIDVFHEGREGKGKSVAALVASMNKLMTRWFSRAVIQLPQQEIIDSLKASFCDTLTKYYELNHKLPERIVIYRDGVGDGRLGMVAEHEVKQLQDSLRMFDKMAGGEYIPKLTIIVVSKRINIRYFKQTGKNLINPPPGTVIDHTATRPNWPDFYLVSQHVRQGTVSPTHYIAIHGHTFLKADHLQRLTYKLTHMYYNWPGTVRVPAPCQYAHKLAYLVGENIRKEPALDLCDRLFYL